MNVEEMYATARRLKQLMIDKGYGSARVSISVQYIGAPLVIFLETGGGRSNPLMGKATVEGLGRLIEMAEDWIADLPDQMIVKREEFYKLVESLSSRAEELGIELPVKLAS
jgi:hypothetical protein